MDTLLLVDDDPDLLLGLSILLRRAGFEVITHDSGFGLAGVVRHHRPNLVILDVSMPGLRGDSALVALSETARNYDFDVDVIFHSGLPAAELAELTASAGAIGYLCKPVEPSDMVATISSMLAQARAKRGVQASV